ncbi:MAG: glycosyl hydrolase [Anaerolineae bacterium]
MANGKLKRVVCVLFCAGLLATPLVGHQRISAQPPPTPDPRFGAVEAFYAPEAATEAGVGWERVLFWWRHLQPNGPHEWDIYYFPDGVLNEERVQGREIVGMLANAPDWANGGQGTAGVPQGLYLPYNDANNLWGQFVQRIVSLYKGRIDHWIIWNEPDVWEPHHPGYTWAGSVEDYYQLLKVGYLAAKEANPQCTIHLAGLTYWWDAEYHREQYFNRFLKVVAQDPTAPDHNHYFDVVTLHIYFRTSSVYDIVTSFRQAMRQHGFEKPIWINETNAPPSEDPQDPVADPRFVVTLDEQASFIIQAFALGLAAGAERVAVYKMIDWPKPPDAVEPYGLLRQDESPRPAFAAYQVVTTYFAGTQEAFLERSTNLDQVTLVQGERTTTVIWNRSPTPKKGIIPAITPQALLVDQEGHTETVTAVGGRYTLELAGAACSDPGCIIPGSPLLLVEEGPVAARGSLLPSTPLRYQPTLPLPS